MITAVLASPLLVAVVAALGGVVVAYLEHGRRQSKKTRADVKAAKYQVENDHSTNLREDLDEIAETARMTAAHVESLTREVRSLGKSVGGLRDDLRLEREERLVIEKRVDAFIS